MRLLRQWLCHWQCWICGNTYTTETKCPYCN